MPTVAITTLGCKVNQYDSDTIAGLFSRRGYDLVEFSDRADVYVINTCAVTHVGERKSRQMIRRCIRKNPAAVIIVTGCYAQVSPEDISAIPGVSLLVGTQQRQQIVDLAEQVRHGQKTVSVVTDIMQATEFEDIPSWYRPSRTRAYLKIQEGCTNFCSYCIIPYTRGPLRSRNPDSVLAAAEQLISAGYQEIILTGIHLGAYGRDLEQTIDLATISERLLNVPGLVRLRLSSLEGTEITDRLIELMHAYPNMCRHLHIALQSGSDTVLRRMKRHYTTAEFAASINSLREKIPDLAITTDLIVGFPGETDEEFAETRNFIEKTDFANIHVFPYSRRKNTLAAAMTDQVSATVRQLREYSMLALAAQKRQQFAQRFVHRSMKVLFETFADGCVRGHTDNYLEVLAPGSKQDEDQLLSVKLQTATNGILQGKIESFL